MSPVFRKGPSGKAFVRVADLFTCPTHPKVHAHGRHKVKFLGAMT